QAFRREARSLEATYIRGEARQSSAQVHESPLLASPTVRASAAALWSMPPAHASVRSPGWPASSCRSCRGSCVFVLDCPGMLPGMPFVIDPGGFYVRPEGRSYIAGSTPDHENAPDDFSLDIDHELFDNRIWPALAERIPAF